MRGMRKGTWRREPGFWKRGSGEMTGFMIVLPCMTFLLLILVSVIQMGMVRSRMEYVAYAAARAAVVSESIEDARTQALNAAQANVRGTGGAKIVLKNVTVEEIDPDTGGQKTKKKKNRKKGRVKASGADTDWGKGTYLRVTVTCSVRTFTVFTSGDRSSSITMMVEEGSGQLFNIDELG